MKRTPKTYNLLVFILIYLWAQNVGDFCSKSGRHYRIARKSNLEKTLIGKLGLSVATTKSD